MYVRMYIRISIHVHREICQDILAHQIFCYVDKVLYVFPIIIITSCSHLNSYRIAQFFQEGNFHEFEKNSPLKSWIKPICEKVPTQIYSAIW